MDYLDLFRLIPLVLTVILVAVFLFFLSSFVLSRTRPPTDEPVIGRWSFILKGTGGLVEGITTTARGAADATVINRLKELTKPEDSDDDDSEEENEKLDTTPLSNIVNKLHLYAVRDGRDRVLIVSDVPIEGNEYSEKEGRNRWVFPFGPTAHRRIIGYAGVDVSKDTEPEFFKQHKPEWDRCVVIFPDDIENGKPRNLELPEKARDMAESLMLLKEVSLDVASINAMAEKLEIQDRALRRLGENVSEEMNRRLLAEEESYRTAFEQPGEAPERRSSLPRMTKGRFVTIGLAAATGYWYLPQHTRLLPNSSAILGAAAMWAFWLFWDKWLSEWF